MDHHDSTTTTTTTLLDDDHHEDVVEKLPGFRFHPTEEELLNFYLKTIIMGKKLRGDIITFLNIYNYDPRELPGLSKIGEREWYFFVPRDRKQGTGGRPNRTTEKGFWKATGSDRKILSTTTTDHPKNKLLGLRKTLVFYEGRAPRGRRTDWIMNEYRLPDTFSSPKDIVLCKIYRKATSLKVLEQRAAIELAAAAVEIKNNTSTIYHGNSSNYAAEMEDSMSSFSNQLAEEEEDETNMTTTTLTSTESSSSIAIMNDPPQSLKKENDHNDHVSTITLVAADHHVVHLETSTTTTSSIQACPHELEDGTKTTTMTRPSSSSSGLVLPNGMMGNLGDLQVPTQLANMDWTQDAFWSQFRSPWLDNLASFLPLCQ